MTEKKIAPRSDIDKILSYIDAHLARIQSVSAIASLMGYSVSHFHRIFREATGYTPSEYVQERRIARAKALLEASDLTVTEIAASVGMRDVGYLSRLFRTHTGKTPTEYRASVKSRAAFANVRAKPEGG